MAAPDLESFRDRSLAVVDAATPSSRRETRHRLVEPLLETLGWRLPDDVLASDATVAGATLEYVCTVDGVPALFVAVEPWSGSLASDRADAIRRAMVETGVDRAIYATGREYLLLAGAEDRFGCRLPELPAHESALAECSREAVARRLEREDSSAVGRLLALRRSALVDDVTARLADATDGREPPAAFEPDVDRLLDRLIDADGETRPRSGRASGRTDDESRSSDAATATSPAAEERAAESTAPGDDAPTDGDGEYVVRLFADRGSIGAFGHSRSERALVHAAEFCLERGLAEVDLPWRPSDDAPVVLDDSPVDGDGASHRLSNGWYLDVRGTDDDRAARVEALAARSGLRAMLTGDWEPE